MEAVTQASRPIAVGDTDIALAGGVESMSGAPSGREARGRVGGRRR
jgi:acetyl-CoA acetyltransferase